MSEFAIGRSVKRVEDRRFLTGRGRYVDDIMLPRQAHGALVLSPHAHARIAASTLPRAQAAPGVLAVLTGADALADGLGGLAPFTLPEDFGGPKAYRTYWMPLAADRVRCVGDRVAFVVAETARRRRANAADLVAVDYEPLPAVSDVADAAAPRRAAACGPIAPAMSASRFRSASKDATDAAFAKAAHVVRTAAQEPTPVAEFRWSRAARSATTRRRGRLHALHQLAESAWRAHACWRARCCHSPETQAPRDLARCRRRLRHEGQSPIPRTRWCCGRRGAAGGR